MTPYERYLAHHGIKGQKWGVIRTPEELGHDRKAEREKRAKAAEERRQAEEKKISTVRSEIQKKEAVAKRNLSDLSNDELRIKVERLRLEQDYRNLLPKHEPKVSEGRKFAKDVLGTIGKTLLVTVGTGAALYTAKQAIAKMSDDDTAEEIFKLSGKGGGKK